MRPAAIIGFAVLAACAAPEADPIAPTWDQDLKAYCEERSPDWLSKTLGRIDGALPSAFTKGSLAFDRLNLQAPFDGRADAKELQLRLTVQRGEQSVQLSAYAYLTPGSCEVSAIEVIEGFDRLDPPTRFDVAG